MSVGRDIATLISIVILQNYFENKSLHFSVLGKCVLAREENIADMKKKHVMIFYGVHHLAHP